MTHESIGHRQTERDPRCAVRRLSSAISTRTGARAITWRWACCICVTTRCCANRSPSNTSSNVSSAIGVPTPVRAFVWVHLNRLIRKYDLNAIYIAGPGHGAPATLANAYLEGRYSEVYPDKSEDVDGLRKFFKQFSFPGGIGSHCTPETPGSIHEGGELGYSVSHAFGAAFDNPDLLVTVVIGDGEAETGPLMGSLHSNKFLNPIRDGAVLPILHLNGYKIANPTISARIAPEELHSLLVGFGWTPYVVEGDDPAVMHQQMAATLEDCVTSIRSIPGGRARERQLRTTALADDHSPHAERLDGSQRARRSSSGRLVARAPDPDPRRRRQRGAPADAGGVDAPLPARRNCSTRRAGLVPQLKALAPTGARRMSANPHANGGVLRIPLRLPDFRRLRRAG